MTGFVINFQKIFFFKYMFALGERAEYDHYYCKISVTERKDKRLACPWCRNCHWYYCVVDSVPLIPFSISALFSAWSALENCVQLVNYRVIHTALYDITRILQVFLSFWPVNFRWLLMYHALSHAWFRPGVVYKS